jgi:hypothetical protein
MNDKPRTPWWAGGVLLGGVLIFAVATVKPLGVSTQFAVVYEPLKPWLIEPFTYGKMTFPEWLEVSRWMLSIPLATAIGLVVLWWLRYEKASSNSEPNGGRHPEPATLAGAEK